MKKHNTVTSDKHLLKIRDGIHSSTKHPWPPHPSLLTTMSTYDRGSVGAPQIPSMCHHTPSLPDGLSHYAEHPQVQLWAQTTAVQLPSQPPYPNAELLSFPQKLPTWWHPPSSNICSKVRRTETFTKSISSFLMNPEEKKHRISCNMHAAQLSLHDQRKVITNEKTVSRN